MRDTIRDPFNALLGLEIESVTATGLTAYAEIPKEACNVFGAAHGGYVYSLGHVAAAQSAKLCLKRPAVVVNVTSQYLRSLIVSPAQVKTELVRNGRELMIFRVEIRDGKGGLCFSQTVELKEVAYPIPGERTFSQTIVPGDENSPIDPVTDIYYPRLSPFFATPCHIHVLGRGDSGMIYGADRYPETCNLYGAAHGGLIYTACDCAACGSMAFLMERKPVTVSSTIRYLRSAMVGPVKAEGKLVRDGKQLSYYDVEVTDGEDRLVAIAQFVLKSVDYQMTNDPGKEYHRKAFKD